MTSLYIPKFDYKPLTRENVNGKRQYNTPDNKRVPSVTTILSATEPQEKRDSLNQWRKRVGVEKAQAITTEAANRGTRMHSYLETYVKEGKVIDRPGNPYSWASHAMAQVVIEQGLGNVHEFWGVEVPLYFPSIYAGTTDCCGIHAGTESILDFKQTNKPKKDEWIDDYKIQLAAYATAHNEVHGTNIRKGVVLMCVKPVQDEKTFEIITPPQYQEFIIEGTDFDYWTNRWWQRVEEYYIKHA
jgi:genome maintenance exonuclease 1